MLKESGEFSLPPFKYITYMIINRYYPGDPVNIHIKSWTVNGAARLVGQPGQVVVPAELRADISAHGF